MAPKNASHMAGLAMGLFNMGTLQVERRRYEIAGVLTNLAVLQNDTKQYEAAEKSYAEALLVRRNLAVAHPEVYLPSLATTLHNFAILQTELEKYDIAETCYQEALTIRKKLAEVNPQVFLLDVAGSLNSLGSPLRRKKKYDAAETAYLESLETFKAVAGSESKTYSLQLSAILLNLSIFYTQSKRDKKKALTHVRESLSYAIPLSAVNPDAEDYCSKAINIIKAWGENPAPYLVTHPAIS